MPVALLAIPGSLGLAKSHTFPGFVNNYKGVNWGQCTRRASHFLRDKAWKLVTFNLSTTNFFHHGSHHSQRNPSCKQTFYLLTFDPFDFFWPKYKIFQYYIQYKVYEHHNFLRIRTDERIVKFKEVNIWPFVVHIWVK